MKIGVVGSRDFNDYKRLKNILDLYKGKVSKIISGGAAGADSLAKRWAKENGVVCVEHLPDWGQHGKFAGPLRNTNIVNDSDLVIAFWDKSSRGTKDSIKKAHKAGKTLMIVYF